MIQPGIYHLKIPAGSQFQQTLELTDAAGTALPLTAYGPFRAQIRAMKRTDPLIAEIAVDNAELAAGKITLSLSKAQTTNAKGRARWDLIDDAGRPWVTGDVDLGPTITEPPL
ncbi:hypothetical protein OKA04_23400 [Luteolibacter flavescens]|uniref:Uncharacterized protein n=1 Tax=Luteolibacter flavescens TaxID=1859460 RepID=A0ABT3FVU4_9BACT|nr:hypothetical protein [Luteolibacter flavescens]MCW1887703.1 hypothetical protein [Luteolibacter flavescens]